jgi:hypothetical protein
MTDDLIIDWDIDDWIIGALVVTRGGISAASRTSSW